MYQTFLISVSHFQARVNRKMCLITGCGVSVSMAFTPEQRHDARYLLARLWPAIMNPNCWIPGSGLGRGVFLDASKYAVCESWLRCHAPKDFHWRDILIHVNATYRWHTHERNTGASLLVGLTDYCGGELEVQEEGTFSTSESMVFFDGRKRHRTCAFLGLRVTLVAFSV